MPIRPLIIALLTLFLATPLFSQDDPVIENVERKNANGVVVEKYKTVDGKKEGAYQSFYDDGAKRSVGSHLHDRRNGAWVDYHSNGNKSFEANYNKGDLTGAASEYYANGQVSRTTTFTNGYAKGSYTTYHENGQVASKGEVSSSEKNGLDHVTREGAWKWYYQDGVLQWETDYKDGNWHGTSTQYHANGKKYRQGTFENGFATGTFKQWHDNGQLEVEGEVSSGQKNSFDHPVRQGTWKWYFRDGVTSWEINYKNNNWDGTVVQYHSNGNEYQKGTFSAGHANGELTLHHANGQLYGSGEVSDSQTNSFNRAVYQGDWTWYHENGNKSWEGAYQDANWNGQITRYHDNGQKYVEADYENGIARGTFTQFHANGQIYSIGEADGSDLNSENHLVRTGLWANYYEDGTRSFEGTYVEGKLDGTASWYHANGQKSALTEWVEGKMRGSWTGWHDNGNKWGHGYSYDGYGTSPKKHGPWVWYHDNGKKQSEGKYDHDKAVGPWIYYDTNGKVDKIENYVDGKSTGISEAELQDGRRIIRTHNPDGSSDTYTVDKDGNIVDHEHKLPKDKQKPSISYVDPDTGETTTITHDGDGNPTITKGSTTTDEDGTTHTHEEDDDGTVRDIVEHPDGRREFHETRPDGTVRESSRDKDGNIKRTVKHPDGRTTEYTLHPDGRKTRTLRDADGNVVEEAERTPVGVETVKRPDGTTTRRHKDEDGNWVETTERPDGTTSRVVRDAEGNVIERDDNYGERDPGQSLYEDVEGGRNWDDLTPEEKAEYAANENGMKENGSFEDVRNRANDADLQRRDEARNEADNQLQQAQDDLKREPATNGATPPSNTVDKKKLGEAAKALELALRMSDIPFEQIQEDLKKAIGDKDAAKIAELLDQDKNSLPGWLDRNRDIATKWTQAVKSSGSAVASALAVSKGVDHLFKGEYGAALEEFAGASASAFGAIPPETMARIESELGRNPANQALALKSAIAFGRELSRPLKPGESRNYGTLLKEGVNFMVNGWKSMPEAQRKHFVERNIPAMGKWLESLDKGIGGSSVKRSAGLLALVESAPHVYKLISEWGGPNDAANITTLAQKVGPKAIGLLVQASTRSETAGAAAELIAQLGADYMAHLGNEAREAARGALRQTEADSTSYNRMRDAMRALAVQAGMTRRDSEEFETVSNLVSGHRGKLVLNDMRRQKNLLGVREAMQAWRRIDNDLNHDSGNVNAFYSALSDSKYRPSSENQAYRIWLNNQVNNARRTSQRISEVISEYDRNGSAYKYLMAWKHDLDTMVGTFG
ncbi:MAG: hypothetical protein KDB82_01775 [Planctomycetes bacterium]|nr:hypothetical protein [Planctomycetota bacterium]